jgi:hypothetical protein
MVEHPLENIKKLIKDPEKASEKELEFFFRTNFEISIFWYLFFVFI